MDKDEEIKQLNTALKGEYMAIESFENFIEFADDDYKREKMIEIQRRHKNQATRVADRIHQLGGRPINSAGLTGKIADIKQQMTYDKREDVFSKAIDGEKFGIDELTKILGDINNDESQDLLKDIIIKNKLIVKELTDSQR